MNGIMPFMKREDIVHLASLARIRLTEQEVDDFATELPSILEYVSAVTDLVGDEAVAAPTVGARYNVLREDIITNEPGSFSKDILAEMPHKEGKFMKVKKILKIED